MEHILRFEYLRYRFCTEYYVIILYRKNRQIRQANNAPSTGANI